MDRKPARTQAHGLKLAIGAAALAATVGGWAALAPQTPPATLPAPATASAPEWLLAPPPVPTLAPVASLDGAPAAPAPRQPAVAAAPAFRPAPLTVTRSSR